MQIYWMFGLWIWALSLSLSRSRSLRLFKWIHICQINIRTSILAALISQFRMKGDPTIMTLLCFSMVLHCQCHCMPFICDRITHNDVKSTLLRLDFYILMSPRHCREDTLIDAKLAIDLMSHQSHRFTEV